MALGIKVGNIQTLMSKPKAARPSRPLVRFTVSLDNSGRILLTIHGWIMGADRKPQPPAPFGFTQRRLVIVEADETYLLKPIRDLLLANGDVEKHLGPEPEGTPLEVKGELEVGLDV